MENTYCMALEFRATSLNAKSGLFITQIAPLR